MPAVVDLNSPLCKRKKPQVVVPKQTVPETTLKGTLKVSYTPLEPRNAYQSSSTILLTNNVDVGVSVVLTKPTNVRVYGKPYRLVPLRRLQSHLNVDDAVRDKLFKALAKETLYKKHQALQRIGVNDLTLQWTVEPIKVNVLQPRFRPETSKTKKPFLSYSHIRGEVTSYEVYQNVRHQLCESVKRFTKRYLEPIERAPICLPKHSFCQYDQNSHFKRHYGPLSGIVPVQREVSAVYRTLMKIDRKTASGRNQFLSEFNRLSKSIVLDESGSMRCYTTVSGEFLLCVHEWMELMGFPLDEMIDEQNGQCVSCTCQLRPQIDYSDRYNKTSVVFTTMDEQNQLVLELLYTCLQTFESSSLTKRVQLLYFALPDGFKSQTLMNFPVVGDESTHGCIDMETIGLMEPIWNDKDEDEDGIPVDGGSKFMGEHHEVPYCRIHLLHWSTSLIAVVLNYLQRSLADFDLVQCYTQWFTVLKNRVTGARNATTVGFKRFKLNAQEHVAEALKLPFTEHWLIPVLRSKIEAELHTPYMEEGDTENTLLLQTMSLNDTEPCYTRHPRLGFKAFKPVVSYTRRSLGQLVVGSTDNARHEGVVLQTEPVNQTPHLVIESSDLNQLCVMDLMLLLDRFRAAHVQETKLHQTASLPRGSPELCKMFGVQRRGKPQLRRRILFHRQLVAEIEMKLRRIGVTLMQSNTDVVEFQCLVHNEENVSQGPVNSTNALQSLMEKYQTELMAYSLESIRLFNARCCYHRASDVFFRALLSDFILHENAVKTNSTWSTDSSVPKPSSFWTEFMKAFLTICYQERKKCATSHN